MRNDNEAKMKAILNELEDDFLEDEKEDREEIEELVVNDENNEDIVEEEEIEVLTEVEEDIEEEEAAEDEKIEESSAEEETEEDVSLDEVKETDDSADDKKEEIEEVDSEEKEVKEELRVKESPVRKMGVYLLDKLKKYKYVIILNIVVFLFLFFLIPAIILEVKPVVWMTLFLVFTILPTVAFYLGRLFQKYQILFSIPFFYLCILTVLDNCTIKDLYGITSHGALDRTPAWVDAIFVTFIIVFFQYLGLTVIDLARKCLKKKRTKEK